MEKGEPALNRFAGDVLKAAITDVYLHPIHDVHNILDSDHQSRLFNCRRSHEASISNRDFEYNIGEYLNNGKITVELDDWMLDVEC